MGVVCVFSCPYLSYNPTNCTIHFFHRIRTNIYQKKIWKNQCNYPLHVITNNLAANHLFSTQSFNFQRTINSCTPFFTFKIVALLNLYCMLTNINLNGWTYSNCLWWRQALAYSWCPPKLSIFEGPEIRLEFQFIQQLICHVWHYEFLQWNGRGLDQPMKWLHLAGHTTQKAWQNCGNVQNMI